VSLEEHYKNDPELLGFSQKKLLEPCWAGELSPDELDYVRSQLRQSSSLRRRWGFRPSAKRLSESRIRAIARNGLRAISRRVLASAKVAALPDLFPLKRAYHLAASYKKSPLKSLRPYVTRLNPI
jgi:hypothetical protein